MGTKNNPGKFDCYENAAPDEPMFILLARDKHAPMLVEIWAMLRAMGDEDEFKIVEAQDCATSMRKWRADNRPRTDRDKIVEAAHALSCDAQFEIARRVAANVGYVLVGEPVIQS